MTEQALSGTAQLQRALDFITKYPERHQQGSWFYNEAAESDSFDSDVTLTAPDTCGTAGCLAGWGAALAGYHMIHHGDGDAAFGLHETLVPRYQELAGSDFHAARKMLEENGSGVRGIATDLFGLNPEEAYALFSGDRSIVDLWALAYVITEGEIELPATLNRPGYVEAEGMSVREHVADALWQMAVQHDNEVVLDYLHRNKIDPVEGMPAEKWLVYG